MGHQEAELYQTTPQNIILHLKAIYQEGELDLHATCKEVLQVQIETSPSQCKMAEQVKYPIRRYLKDLNKHICFAWNSVVKDFFTTDAISAKRPSGGSNVNIRANTGG